MIPLRPGSADDFARVRAFLQRSNYCEEAICARLGVEHIFDLDLHKPGNEDVPPADELDALIRIFFKGDAIAHRHLQSLVPEPVLASMQELGLLSACPAQPDRLMATVFLCPIQTLYLAADRWSNPDNSPLKLPADAVYPPNTPNTRHFLATLPATPCASLLELGTGSGVAALLAASRYAGHVWAVDIAERSVWFAEFNRRLNVLENVTVACGDLYAPVDGLRFERIVAHPPFAPVLAPKYVFHDGGEDGEAITRRIVEEAPRHLCPGGRLYCLGLGTDRTEPFEQRVRAWLGVDGTQCDLLVVVWHQLTPEAFAADTALKDGNPEERGIWIERLAQLGVRSLLHSSIVVHRNPAPGRTFTVRRNAGPRSTPAEVEWQLACELVGMQPDAFSLLAHARPVFPRDVKLTITFTMQDGRMLPSEYRVRTDYPFPLEGQVEPWMSDLIAACDGSRTTLELLEAVKQGKLVEQDAPPEKFAALIFSFLSRGFLQIAELSLPAAAG